jgi:hypothetical protein
MNDIHHELYNLRQEMTKALSYIRIAADDYSFLPPHGKPATLTDIYRELSMLRTETSKELSHIRFGVGVIVFFVVVWTIHYFYP